MPPATLHGTCVPRLSTGVIPPAILHSPEAWPWIHSLAVVAPSSHPTLEAWPWIHSLAVVAEDGGEPALRGVNVHLLPRGIVLNLPAEREQRQNSEWCVSIPCSGSEAGSYLRLIDFFVYHSTLGLRVIKKKRFREAHESAPTVPGCSAPPIHLCLGRSNNSKAEQTGASPSKVKHTRPRVLHCSAPPILFGLANSAELPGAPPSSFTGVPRSQENAPP